MYIVVLWVTIGFLCTIVGEILEYFGVLYVDGDDDTYVLSLSDVPFIGLGMLLGPFTIIIIAVYAVFTHWEFISKLNFIRFLLTDRVLLSIKKWGK